ncbi:MAG: ATP-grasp domain-containing protein [Acidobacteria bacterium]|nr:ATP-grasp domain-containing protein [Acidobacteriota bacterium]
MNITLLFDHDPAEGAEHDVAERDIAAALQEAGHTVNLLTIYDDLDQFLKGIKKQRPDVVFNLCESFAGNNRWEMHVAAVLELLHVPYTGAPPTSLHLAQDKALAKKIFTANGIPSPAFAVAGKGKLPALKYPLLVKPLYGDASLGIDVKSVVHTPEELSHRLKKGRGDAPLIIEEYVEGREFYVGVLGNEDPQVLPLIEMDFSKLPAGRPHIVDWKAKWEERTVEYRGTTLVFPDDLPEALQRNIGEIAVKTYRALELRDYGRVDFRVPKNGEPHVIEANPNPYLDKEAEFVRAAQRAGYTYPKLLQTLVEFALSRSPSDKKS